MSIKVALVEDNRITRESLVSLLARTAELSCVGAFATAELALGELPRSRPDVVLLDINLPGMNGVECVARLKLALPAVHVLMLTTYEDADLIFESIRAGASGYLLKKSPPSDVIRAITEAHAGGAPLSMGIARKVVDHFRRIVEPKPQTESLSDREKEVLALVAQGCLYKEIAERLGIAIGTVRTYVQRSCEKLHVNSRTEAAVKFGALHPQGSPPPARRG